MTQIKSQTNPDHCEPSDAPPPPQASTSPFTIEDQLQLLLTNLQKNIALKKEKLPTTIEEIAKRRREATGRNQDWNDQGAESGRYDATCSEEKEGASHLITTAYKMITEVIMHPTIMWNRQFFYSLAAMDLTQ